MVFFIHLSNISLGAHRGLFGDGGINYLDLQPSKAVASPTNPLDFVSSQLSVILHRLVNIERLLTDTQTLGKFDKIINVS